MTSLSNLNSKSINPESEPLEVVGLMIYQNRQLVSEAFQLRNRKRISWLNSLLSGSEKKLFKETAHQLAEDLLKDLKPQEHNIIRSETWSKYQVHLLLNKSQSKIPSQTIAETPTETAFILIINHSQSLIRPIQLAFDYCLKQDPVTYIDGLKLLNSINQHLSTYQTFDHIQADIDTTRQQLIENLNKVVERQETLEELLDKSHQLNQSSASFKKRSRRLNNWCCYLL